LRFTIEHKGRDWSASLVGKAGAVHRLFRVGQKLAQPMLRAGDCEKHTLA